jgi:hypothetical protein
MDATCLNLRQSAVCNTPLAINRFFTQPNCKPGIMRYDADSLHPRAALELLLIRDFWGGIDFFDRLSGAPARLLVMLERPCARDRKFNFSIHFLLDHTKKGRLL